MHGLKPEFWFLVHASLCKGKRKFKISNVKKKAILCEIKSLEQLISFDDQMQLLSVDNTTGDAQKNLFFLPTLKY
ncbi:hypothetical protein BpHYR1_001929 [Brachionus plicatilis]|uniref:Uncharacterized protein n=1 Tax=Brachionus plicatilis TaxID=10195 RepID=A0A3M7RS23_BRAPC|nr:hypothetical protein BpHYR1_001929 [Brachionus plicatilis]